MVMVEFFQSKSIRNGIGFFICLAILYLGAVIFFNIRGLRIEEWPLGELLINYQGGFVRRGIYGQMLLSLADGRPMWLAVVMQKIIIVLVIGYLAYIVAIWKSADLSIIFGLGVIFSPGALLDMAAGGAFEYLDRKEIIFYLALISIYFILVDQQRIEPMRLLLITFICSILVLTHEIFYIVFCPPLFFLLLQSSRKSDTVNKIKVITYFIIPVSVVFVLTVLFPGDAKTAAAIKLSLSNTDAKGIGGGIFAIGWKLKDTLNLVRAMYNDGSIMYWIFHMLLGVGFNAAFCALLLRGDEKDKAYYFSFFWISAAIIVCACLGWDWGRWISIASIGIPLMFAVIYTYQPRISERGRSATLGKGAHLVLAVLILILCLWSFYTRPLHCCAQGLDRIIFSEQNFKRAFPF